MKPVKCLNGHYFDGDKFERCPICFPTRVEEVPYMIPELKAQVDVVSASAQTMMLKLNSYNESCSDVIEKLHELGISKEWTRQDDVINYICEEIVENQKLNSALINMVMQLIESFYHGCIPEGPGTENFRLL